MSSGSQTSELISLFGPPQSPPPAAPQAPPAPAKGGLIFLLIVGGYLAILFGTIFLLVDGYVAGRLYYRLANWPHVAAEVLRGELYPNQALITTGNSTTYSKLYGFRAQIAFPVGAKTHLTTVDIGYQTSDRSAMAEWMDRFPSGTETTVAYDPENPNRVLFAGDFLSAYAPAWFLARYMSLVIAGGVLAVWLGRKLRGPRPDESEATEGVLSGGGV